MRYREIVEASSDKELVLPTIEVGDEVKVGKFKNRKAIVKGFTTDDHNQPVLKTDKGDQKLFKPRITKLMTEGLIAVPAKMEAEIKRVLLKNVLWWARDQFKGKTRTLPKHYEAFKALVKQYGVVLPKEPYTKDQILGYYIPVNLEGMPSSYLKNVPEDKDIRFAIIWNVHNTIGGNGMLGGWMQVKKILAIKPLAVPYLDRYPSARNHPDDLKIGLDVMLEAIHHELRHMVQSMLLGDHPEQTKKLPGEAGTPGYYASLVEFDPQIGTAIHHFVEMWKEYPSKDLKQTMLKYVGMAPSSKHEPFSTAEVFAALRDHSPKRYKIAIKKFVTGVQSKLTEVLPK